MSVAPNNMLTPVSASNTYREALAQIDDKRFGEALASHDAAMAYAAELIDGYRVLDTISQKADGQKARHGAYIYRLYASTAVKGKIEIEGKRVALGQVVGAALGRWEGEYNPDGSKKIKPLASPSVTRYRYIATLVDLGYSPDDPEWANLVNYYVTDPRLTSVLKRTDPAPTRAEVDAVYLALTTVPKAIEPKSDDKSDDEKSDDESDESDENSQGPENPEGEGDKSDDKGDESKSDDSGKRREPQVPGHEIAEILSSLPRGFAHRLTLVETIVFGAKSEDLTPDVRRRLVILGEEIAKITSA